MKRFATLSAGLILGSPTLALAAEHSASYRGIGWIYFTFIAGILVLETDRMGELAVWQGESSVEQTAYALLSDLLEIVSSSGWSTQAGASGL